MTFEKKSPKVLFGKAQVERLKQNIANVSIHSQSTLSPVDTGSKRSKLRDSYQSDKWKMEKDSNYFEVSISK